MTNASVFCFSSVLVRRNPHGKYSRTYRHNPAREHICSIFSVNRNAVPSRNERHLRRNLPIKHFLERLSASTKNNATVLHQTQTTSTSHPHSPFPASTTLCYRSVLPCSSSYKSSDSVSPDSAFLSFSARRRLRLSFSARRRLSFSARAASSSSISRSNQKLI